MIRYLSLLLLANSSQGCTTISDPAPRPLPYEVAGAWVGLSSRGALWRVVLNRDGDATTDGVAVVHGDSAYPDELERIAVRSWELDKYDIQIVMDAPRHWDTRTMEWRGTASANVMHLRNDSYQTLILQREDGFAARLERLKDGGN